MCNVSFFHLTQFSFALFILVHSLNAIPPEEYVVSLVTCAFRHAIFRRPRASCPRYCLPRIFLPFLAAPCTIQIWAAFLVGLSKFPLLSPNWYGYLLPPEMPNVLRLPVVNMMYAMAGARFLSPR
jgi:hypothetical protein